LNVYNATKPSTSASSSMRLRHRSKSIQVFEREQRALDDEFFYELKRHKKKQHKKNDGDSTSLELPPPVCTCPYFGDKPSCTMMKPIEVKIITTSSSNFLAPERASIHSKQQQNESNQFISISSNSISNTPSTVSLPLQSSLNRVHRKQSYTKCNAIVTWDSRHSYHRRGSNLNGSTRTTLLAPTQPKSNLINPSPLRRSATLRHNNNNNNNNNNNIMMNSDENSTSVSKKIPSSPCILQRATTIRSHHSRNSSVISRNSARHGRIIRLEQKATKVLGVVFFTFVSV
jgi:5-hydroxytryptamine receptor 2